MRCGPPGGSSALASRIRIHRGAELPTSASGRSPEDHVLSDPSLRRAASPLRGAERSDPFHR
jgi:hypothetical protein